MNKPWAIFCEDGRLHTRFYFRDSAEQFLIFLRRTCPGVQYELRHLTPLEDSLLDLGYNLADLDRDNPFNTCCDFADGTKRDAERGFAAPVSAGSPPLLTGGETKREEGGKHE